MNRRLLPTAGLAAALGLGLALAGCEAPSPLTAQNGFRGTGMDQLHTPEAVAKLAAANVVPPPPYPLDPDTGGERAGTAYQNVKVLGDVSADEFNRLMASITEWVAPKEGCTYCHNAENMASDELYTKVVARRMLQMTRNINTNWKPHFAGGQPGAGVTCWTCHRGNAVPVYHWSFDPRTANPPTTIIGNRHGQDAPNKSVAMAALPNDPFTPYLFNATNIRVAGNSAFPSDHNTAIISTEATYGLMMHISKSLGVNCTYCHNAQNFRNWETSTPQRATAWYGIRMVRDLNTNYVQPLTTVFPANRVGPMGDPYKINCATCHQGLNKPLGGVPMLKDHPALAGIRSPVAAAAPTVAANASAAPVEPVAAVEVAPATTPAATTK